MSYYAEKCQKIIEGLMILSKYDGASLASEHDIIYAGPDNVDLVSPEDRSRLEKLSWFVSDDVDSWAHFV